MERACIDDAPACETVGLRLRTPTKPAILCVICRFIIEDFDCVRKCYSCPNAICTDCIIDSTEGPFCCLKCVSVFISSQIEQAQLALLSVESKKYV
jgi:hypothetical protein